MSGHGVDHYSISQGSVFPSQRRFWLSIAEAFASVVRHHLEHNLGARGGRRFRAVCGSAGVEEIRSAMIAMRTRQRYRCACCVSFRRSHLFTKARMIEQTLMVYESVLGRVNLVVHQSCNCENGNHRLTGLVFQWISVASATSSRLEFPLHRERAGRPYGVFMLLLSLGTVIAHFLIAGTKPRYPSVAATRRLATYT